MQNTSLSIFNRVALLLMALLLLSVSGCSRFNCTRFEKFVGDETDLIAFSYSIAEKLTTTASPPLVLGISDMPILVTTFVDNNNLEKTSKFGRIIQEHISSRLVQLGYPVKEIKMTGQLMIEPKSGESILSRDIGKIAPSVKSQAILVGTISITNRTMYVSSRLVHPVTNTIIASTDSNLCMDDTILTMFGLQQQHSSGEISEPPRPRLNSILY
ncbi:FlgO family outer membrane protein [Desulfopila aestuarii]|uniref:FlgO domain-containing protein n=1 Tax=Desulfopila aestuarii DSM 18488 TaxID=1121416 RepID=A0A1M7Y270_9BACT|nr:FlgO family outer membrane protein [Desulfopila aestuarii]SHO45999.1 hypothetical protein SAMN02745220_01289 [Desulfopila aestuarii DSM 18488]